MEIRNFFSLICGKLRSFVFIKNSSYKLKSYFFRSKFSKILVLKETLVGAIIGGYIGTNYSATRDYLGTSLS
jgi:hypothetical protein